MAMRRENVAAALRYLQGKADLRGRLQRATSLDPQEQDLADIAVETGASLIPGVGPALAARDFERARRADDEAGMAMAAASAVPGGKLAGLLKRYDPTRLELDVYHGTPHKFPATEANPLGEFDASKIGTGEGAQAYGHGTYFAEAPDVAKGYRERLSGTNPNVFRLGDNEFSIVGGSPEVKKFVSAAKQKGFSTESAALAYQTLRQFDGNLNAAAGELGWRDISGPFDEEAANLLRAVQFKPEGGALYKADLPDEMIDRMLDWDKPLSEQRELATPILKELGYLRPTDDGPRQFSQAVKALALEHGGFGESGATGMALFNAIYKGLQQGKPKAINLAKRMNLNEREMFMEASPLASEVMKRMGIPGIKYLDAGSRGQGGSGTRNFVVFPGEEKKVRILERK